MQEVREMGVWSLGREDPWRREWQSTLVFLPGKFHRQRNPGGLQSTGSQSPTRLSIYSTVIRPNTVPTQSLLWATYHLLFNFLLHTGYGKTLCSMVIHIWNITIFFPFCPPPHAPKSAMYSSTAQIFSITHLVTLLSPFVTSKVSPSAAADMARWFHPAFRRIETDSLETRARAGWGEGFGGCLRVPGSAVTD